MQAAQKWMKVKDTEFLGGARREGTALLWLGRRLAATAPIQPLAWEPPYAAGGALEKAKRPKKKKKKI